MRSTQDKSAINIKLAIRTVGQKIKPKNQELNLRTIHISNAYKDAKNGDVVCLFSEDQNSKDKNGKYKGVTITLHQLKTHDKMDKLLRTPYHLA